MLKYGRTNHLENAIQQIAAHMGLFQQEDQLGRHKSCDIDRNSGAHDGVRMKKQIQDGGRGTNNGAREEPQNQDGRFERAEEANREVTDEGRKECRMTEYLFK